MIIDGKIVLNPYTTDLDFLKLVDIGDMIVSAVDGEEYNLTSGKEYELLGHDGDCIMVKNDLGNREYYSVDYFKKHNNPSFHGRVRNEL